MNSDRKVFALSHKASANSRSHSDTSQSVASLSWCMQNRTASTFRGSLKDEQLFKMVWLDGFQHESLKTCNMECTSPNVNHFQRLLIVGYHVTGWIAHNPLEAHWEARVSILWLRFSKRHTRHRRLFGVRAEIFYLEMHDDNSKSTLLHKRHTDYCTVHCIQVT